MALMTDRKAIKRALNAKGIEHFAGWVEADEINKLQALSAKTSPTVQRIRREIDGDMGGDQKAARPRKD